MKRFMVVLAMLLASSISAFAQMGTGQGGDMMGGGWGWGSGWGMGYGGFGVIVAIAVILVVVLIIKRK